MAVALFGCGGDDGATGPQGLRARPALPALPARPARPAGGHRDDRQQHSDGRVASSPPTPRSGNRSIPTVTVTGVTIASPPVVNFTVTDAAGQPVVGLGNTTKSQHGQVRQLPQPRVRDRQAGARHQRQPEQVGQLHRDHGADDQRPARVRAPTRPSTDNTGTLVDNGDGTYKYTFYRDITTIKAQVAAMPPVTAANNKADLGDLTYDPTLTHRVTIQLSGNAPGTGTNTPTGATGPVPTGVPLKNPV